MARATLYVIPGSHPAMAVRGMLEHKGIEYRRVDLLPVVSRGVLKMLRFPGITVPSLRIDGRRITGSREISKALDEIEPDPPLFPSDPAARVQVEDAERWGDEIPQNAVRRILWNAIKRDRKPLRTFLDGAKIGLPHGLAVATAAPFIAAEIRIHDVTDDAVKADLTAFPAWLDRVDDWIAGGVLGGEPPNAADFQIAAVLRLSMTMDDLRPAIESRPCGELTMWLFPEFPGRIAPVLPDEWLEPLRAGASPVSA